MKETQALSENAKDDPMDEKIKGVNAKILPCVLGATILGGIIAACFCPFSGVFVMLLWTAIISVNLFVMIYQLLFYLFAKELIIEAKKRGKYIAHKWINPCDCDPTSLGDGFITTDIRYHYHPSNMYYPRDTD